MTLCTIFDTRMAMDLLKVVILDYMYMPLLLLLAICLSGATECAILYHIFILCFVF